MLENKSSIRKSVDWFTIILYLIMIVAGWFSICGASYDFDNPNFFSLSSRSGMQLVWIGISAVLIFIIMMLDKSFFETFSFPIYGFMLLLLVITIFIAPDIKGSRSWLVITSSIRLQPAEFAKFATALALAKFMDSYDFNLLTFKNFTMAILIILIPSFFILMQRETGSALVFFALFLVLYREGMSGYVLMTVICAVIFFIVELKYEDVFWNMTPVGSLIVTALIMFIVYVMLRYILHLRKIANIYLIIVVISGVAGYLISLFYPFDLTWIAICLIIGVSVFLLFYSLRKLMWQYALLAVFALVSLGFMSSVNYAFNNVLEPHQQKRIKVTLGLENDNSGAGYNVNQSMIAIGSGGLTGKGFLNGTQTKLKYVPEQDTDFIFCTVGEEFGFVGTFFVLFIYCIFLLRLLALAERQSTAFGRVYGYSVLSIFLFHVLVNIGMVIGIMPVIGIPLPFFSYGGSSLLGFTILLFVFLRIDATRKEDLS